MSKRLKLEESLKLLKENDEMAATALVTARLTEITGLPVTINVKGYQELVDIDNFRQSRLQSIRYANPGAIITVGNLMIGATMIDNRSDCRDQLGLRVTTDSEDWESGVSYINATRQNPSPDNTEFLKRTSINEIQRIFKTILEHNYTSDEYYTSAADINISMVTEIIRELHLVASTVKMVEIVELVNVMDM